MSLKKYIHQVKPRDESYVNHVDRIQSLLRENYAEDFEGNLLIAMGADSSEVGSYNDDDDSKSIANSIVGKMKNDGISAKNPKRIDKGNLSKLYSDFGVKSTKSKADISFDNEGVSVKDAAGSQLLSAQGPEVAAIVQYVVTTNAAAAKAAGNVADQVPNALKNAFSPENYYAGRAGTGPIASKGVTYPTELQYKADNAKKGIKGLTPAQKKKIAAAKKELSAGDRALTTLINGSDASDYIEGAKKFGISEEISKAIKIMFNLDDVKQAIILEAMTGNGKFATKDARASQVLSWGKNGLYSYKTVEDASANVSGYNFRVSDRGSKSSKVIKNMGGDLTKLSGELTGRGGSIRIDMPPSLQDGYIHTTTENCIDEIANDIGESHRAYLTENLEYAQELLLQEGFFDRASRFIRNLKDKVMKGINSLVEKIKTFVSKIGNYIMKLVKNTGYYLMAFDMKPQLSFKVS